MEGVVEQESSLVVHVEEATPISNTPRQATISGTSEAASPNTHQPAVASLMVEVRAGDEIVCDAAVNLDYNNPSPFTGSYARPPLTVEGLKEKEARRQETFLRNFSGCFCMDQYPAMAYRFLCLKNTIVCGLGVYFPIPLPCVETYTKSSADRFVYRSQVEDKGPSVPVGQLTSDGEGRLVYEVTKSTLCNLALPKKQTWRKLCC